MIWHPLVWAFWAAAATGAVLYIAAGRCAMDVVVNYLPGAADRRQLLCERRAEAMGLLGRWALGSLTAAALIGLVGIARIWHDVVPGAMCGTGVLQAMGTAGTHALLFWAGALSILSGWRVLERLDRTHPDGAMIQTAARLLLVAAPLLILALSAAWQALMRIDTAPPVSCCAAVYDQIFSTPANLPVRSWLAPLARWTGLAGAVLLPVAARLAAVPPYRIHGGTMVLLAIGWAIASTAAVKHTWSAYYYQVLSHPCPWCLFLPDHSGIGFFVFGCLAVALLESLALWAAQHARRHYPALALPAQRRLDRAVRWIAAAGVGFTLLTVGPAVLWRISTGVWMDGSP